MEGVPGVEGVRLRPRGGWQNKGTGRFLQALETADAKGIREQVLTIALFRGKGRVKWPF
jgi:hypothetical protein